MSFFYCLAPFLLAVWFCIYTHAQLRILNFQDPVYQNAEVCAQTINEWRKSKWAMFCYAENKLICCWFSLFDVQINLKCLRLSFSTVFPNAIQMYHMTEMCKLLYFFYGWTCKKHLQWRLKHKQWLMCSPSFYFMTFRGCSWILT